MTVLQTNHTATQTLSGSQSHHEQTSEGNKSKNYSVSLVAILILLSLNVSLSLFQPFHFDPYNFNYHGWSWWTFNDLRLPTKEPNLVLLGSSTMVSAIAGCDANYLHKQLDLTCYHRCQFLEDNLSSAFSGSQFKSFSLAGPGQMPSDAYLSLKVLLANSKHPNVVIYGLAPRDFMDSTLLSPADTEYFKYLTRLVSPGDTASRIFYSPISQLDWFLQNNLYLYKYSLDIRMQAYCLTKNFIDLILPKLWSSRLFTWWDRQKLLPNYLPADIRDESMMAGTIDRQSADASYKDNTQEYLLRYKNPDNQTYKTQMFFLSELAQLCQHEHIKLVLVNMPITLANIKLIRPGAYLDYLQTLKRFSSFYKLAFYNLNDFSSYSKRDFHDSVHLNAFGGQKFFKDLVNSLVQDNKIKPVLLRCREAN